MAPSLRALQAALVEQLEASGAITQAGVAEAFRAVPRHLFLPGVDPAEVYRDEAIPTKFQAGRPISSSSQPAIMAIMLEQLEVEHGQRVLEIGAGTGYNAALLAHLVGPDGHVVTVDIDADLVEAARGHLYAAGMEAVEVVCADGGHGYAPRAPYDRILLTVGAWDLAPAWVEQLAPGGRLVLPLALGVGPQKSIAWERVQAADGLGAVLESVSIRDCGFMRLRGEFAGPENVVALGPEPGLCLTITGEAPVPAETAYEWLTGDRDEQPAGLSLAMRDIWEGAGLWVATHEPHVCEAIAEGPSAASGLVPELFAFGGQRRAVVSLGILDQAGLCLLHWAASAGHVPADRDVARPLAVRCYGPAGRAGVLERLRRHLAEWQAAGRPGSGGMRVRAYVTPREQPAPEAEGETVIHKRWTDMVISWEGRRRRS